MATTTTVEGEDRVLATAQQIVKSLKTSKDVTDDMLLILSSFDNRLSTISDLVNPNPNPNPNHNNNNNNPIHPAILRLDAADDVIHGENQPQHLFDPSSPPDASCDFLAAIDDVLDLLSDLRIHDDDVTILDRAESTVQAAMSRLEDELRRLVLRSAVPIDADKLHGSIRSVTLSFASHDGDIIDEEFNFNNQYFHERGGSIGGDVSVDLVAPDAVSDLRDIADRMILAGYEKECCQVYSSGRRDALEDCLATLGIEKLSIEDVQRIEWRVLDEKMKKWVQAVKIIVRVLLTGEKRLCEMIFDGSELIKEVCFVETAKGCVMQLLNFGEAVAIGKRSPEKLFRVLDMYEGLRDTLPRLEGLFCGESGEFVCGEAKGVLDALGEAALGTFMEFESAVKGEASRKTVHGGEIHPLARYVMNYVKLLVDYAETLNSLLECDVVNNNDNDGEENNHHLSGGCRDRDELRVMTPLGRRLMSLINSLECNLEEKAKFYDDSAMQYIFLMNNKLYIVQKVKDSELGKLLGDDWVKRRRGIIRKYATNYLRASWSKVLACLRDEGIGGSSSNAFKMALKERFKNFNACFEEIYRTQTAWKVPDSQLRTELRISISEKVIPAYRSFLGRFGPQLESGRHAGKYIKYTAEDLDGYLADLFEGTPGVLHHLRRKSS